MTPDPFASLPAGCEACRQQLSANADSGAALPPESRTHLDGCAACAEFAEQWLHGPPPELARPVSGVADARLRERILDAAALPDVIRFPAAADGWRQAWTPWPGRIAACLALAGFSYWLLDPVVSPVSQAPAVVPALTQGLLQMEGGTRHEQEILQTAVVDGGRRVTGNVAWSVSALDL